MDFRKVANLYASPHGHTRKVVERFKDFATFDLADGLPATLDYSIFLFFCPTYGDEEIPAVVEDFLEQEHPPDKQFAICELGNYYGYEDSPFGALPILERRLRQLKWTELVRPLSLDSLPKIDWPKLEIWRKIVYEHILRA